MNDIGLTEFTGDPNEVWSLQAQQQEYDVTTGGRVGAPIDLVPDLLQPLAFSLAGGGFTAAATVDSTLNVTHGFSYVATRTSPSPLTCTAVGYWTDHDGSTTPDPLNPKLLDVRNLVEKPKASEAPSQNAIIGRYILTPAVFDCIASTPPGALGELQLTDAIPPWTLSLATRAPATSRPLVAALIDVLRDHANRWRPAPAIGLSLGAG